MSQQTIHVEKMKDYCWSTVCDDGPTLIKHWYALLQFYFYVSPLSDIYECTIHYPMMAIVCAVVIDAVPTSNKNWVNVWLPPEDPLTSSVLTFGTLKHGDVYRYWINTPGSWLSEISSKTYPFLTCLSVLFDG